MNVTEMSVAYQLQSEDFQVFYDRDDSSFIISKDSCAHCGHEWIHSVQQCIFCGSENYFLWICNEPDCDSLRSLQNANPGEKCDCGGEYFKSCFNKECNSRNDHELSEIILNSRHGKAGLFHKGKGRSGFTISQHFCFNCAEEENYSETFDLKVFDLEVEKKPLEDLYQSYKNDFDFLIFVKNERTKFLTLKTDEFNINNFENRVNSSLFKSEGLFS